MNKPIKLASDTIDSEDIAALCEWLSQSPTPILTKNKLTVEYEQAYADHAKSKYAVFVNSGSSANLLAISVLLHDNSLRNKKIVIPALAWATTLMPCVQLGLTPILCDVNKTDLSVDLHHLEDIFKTEKPAILFLVSVLGMPPDMIAVSELCAKFGVILLLDNCESQGAAFNGRRIETFASMATCSSYAGHISSTCEGGMITTDNEDYYNLLKMARSHGWVRDLSEDKQKHYRKKHATSKFNSLYRFFVSGYNVRNTEIGAFLGLRQLKKVDEFIRKRHYNFLKYQGSIQNSYWKPSINPKSTIANLGYPIISPKIDEIVEALRGNNVEVRPLISGNLGQHPYWIELYGQCCLPFADIADSCGAYLPNQQALTDDDIRFVSEIVNNVINA